jgi:hypothetical protein
MRSLAAAAILGANKRLQSQRAPMRIVSAALMFGFSAGLSACLSNGEGAPDLHFSDFKTEAPRGNTIWLCHAYGCQQQTRLAFTQTNVRDIAALMAKTMKADTPSEERRAVASAVAWMYVYTGKIAGTIADRPGMDYDGSGDPTQMDCVDHSTNTTSFLLVLQHNGLMNHHTVGRSFARGDSLQALKRWPHWTAIIIEKTNSQRWAIDSWVRPIGENPIVVEAEKWRNLDLDHLPKGAS